MSQPDEPTVSISLGGYTHTTMQKPSVCVEVKNEGKAAINEIKVEWVYEYEAPQDGTQNFLATQGAAFTQITGQRPVKAYQVGRRDSFNPEEGAKEGPLEPGETRLYLYPPDWFPAMLSLVQSLSPERYHVAITMNGKEEVAIPGNVFGEFVEKKFGKKESQ